MSGRDWQLPVGDRDHEDNRSAKPARDLSPSPAVPPKGQDEGFTAYMARLSKNPAVVPVCACAFCGQDFNHEPVVPEDMHSEEAKRKGLTWCSVQHRTRSRVMA